VTLRTVDQLVDLPLAPDAYRLRGGTVGERSGTVAWTRLRAPVLLEGFAGTWSASIQAGATGYPTTGERWIKTPPIVASSVYSWSAAQVFADLPAGTSIQFRTSDGTTDRVWNGSSWAAAAGTWSELAHLEHLAAHPTTAGRLAFVFRLVTADRTVTPTIYGIRVAIRLHDWLPERAVLALLLEEIEALAVPSRIQLPGGASSYPLAGDSPRTWSAVDAVLGSSGAVSGTFNSGTQTWTPTTAPLPAGTYTAQVRGPVSVQVAAHRDLTPIGTLPAIVLSVGSQETARGPVGAVLREGDSGLVIAPAERVSAVLELRLVAGTTDALREIRRALASWLGESGDRLIIDPRFGSVISVRSLAPITVTAAGLAVGVPEASGSWRLEYLAPLIMTRTEEALVREDGVNLGGLNP
jgi:hypothetical protein